MSFKMNEVASKRTAAIMILLVATFGQLVLFSFIHSCFAEVGSRGILEVPEKIFDFGSVAQGEKVVHEFEFKNTGNADLLIQRIAPSCGCTAASTVDNVIRAGQSTKIKAEFDTSGFAGLKTKTVDVFTSDLDSPQVSLVIKGTVLPSVTIDPPRLDFGEVLPNNGEQGMKKEFTVTLVPGTELSIASGKVFSKHLTIERMSTGSDNSAKFLVTLDPTLTRGSLRERAVVELQGGRKPSTLTIPIVGFVRGSVRVNPISLSVGIIEGKAPIERTAKIENLGKTPLKVLGVSTSSNAIKAEVKEIQSGQVFVLKIQVDPSKVQSDLRASVEIETDREDEEHLALNVFGVVPPQLAKNR